MRELELKRSPDDRRLYTLGDVGTIRFGGIVLRTATARSRRESWRIARRGLLRREVEATDGSGDTVGRFEPNGLRRGGTLCWADRELTLRPASAWRERYALADGERELAVLDGKGWGRRPVAVSVEDPASIDPGLLLSAAFVVRGLADDANAAAGAASSTAATG